MAEIKFCPKCGQERFDLSSTKCEKCGYQFEKKGMSTGWIVALILIGIAVMSLPTLGVVAALTIPSLVNRQENLAAQTKLKKAIANYETLTSAYMAEYEKKSFANALTPNCDNANKYFKILNQDGCNFETYDSTYWMFDPYTGNAAATDKKDFPTYGVILWTKNGTVNSIKDRPDVNEEKMPSNNPKCIFIPYDFLSKSSSELNKCSNKH